MSAIATPGLTPPANPAPIHGLTEGPLFFLILVAAIIGLVAVLMAKKGKH